jgi:predicted metal-dependent hydrolase
MDLRRDGQFAQGVALFNAGRYFEAHEVWEVMWKNIVGVEKIFLQGLIQAAAAMVHLERDNIRGARSLSAKSRSRLTSLPDCYRVPLEACLDNLSDSLTPRLRAGIKAKPRLVFDQPSH